MNRKLTKKVQNKEKEKVRDPTEGFLVFESEKERVEYFEGEHDNLEFLYDEEEKQFNEKFEEKLKKKKKRKKKTKKQNLTEKILLENNGIKKIINDFPKYYKNGKWGKKKKNTEDFTKMMFEVENWMREIMPDKDFDSSTEFVTSLSGRIITKEALGDLFEKRENEMWKKKEDLLPDDEMEESIEEEDNIEDNIEEDNIEEDNVEFKNIEENIQKNIKEKKKDSIEEITRYVPEPDEFEEEEDEDYLLNIV